MSKYLYATVYEEFTGLKPPEPTDNKQRRKRGYGHPYRMRLNIQEETEIKQKKPERRNQFGQPINSPRKNRDEQPLQKSRELPPQFNAMRNHQQSDEPPRTERREPHQKYNGNSNGNRSGMRSPFGNNFMKGDSMGGNSMDMMAELSEPKSKSSGAAPKVTYKKRRQFTLEKVENSTAETQD